jgi:Rad3-related DNA helicase
MVHTLLPQHSTEWVVGRGVWPAGDAERLIPSPKELDLPAPSWWVGQEDSIQAILDGFSKTKYVFANIPTGGGKSIIAAAVQKIMDVRALYLTHTIQLQDQYLRTLPKARTMTGRGNHKCEMVPGMLADAAACTVGEGCEYIRPGGCGYYSMLFEVADTEVAVLNYAYATRVLQVGAMRLFKNKAGRSINPFRDGRDLLVCDEGDLLQNTLCDAFSISITYSRWTRAGIELPENKDSIESWQYWAVDKKETIDNEAVEMLRLRGEALAAENDEEARRILKELVAITKFQHTLDEILDVVPSEWKLSHEQGKTEFHPLWARSVSGSVFFGFKHVLIMSATLPPPEILAGTLGIREEDYTYVDRPSVFPASHRPVMYWPIVKLNKSSGDQEWERVASAISFLSSQPGLKDGKGLIHTGSRANADKLMSLLDDDRFITHTSFRASREEVLERFRTEARPLVLVTPSFTIGLDLPYIIRWQVIAKVPFGNLGDTLVKARWEYDENGSKFGRRFYDASALNTVVQAAGRIVRTPEDRGPTYILDANFWPLYKRAHSPQFFKEAVYWLNSK